MELKFKDVHENSIMQQLLHAFDGIAASSSQLECRFEPKTYIRFSVSDDNGALNLQEVTLKFLTNFSEI